MKPVSFQGQNKIYKSPHPDVGPLPVREQITRGEVTSAWLLSDKELMTVLENKRVYVTTWSGKYVFPICVHSELDSPSPNKSAKERYEDLQLMIASCLAGQEEDVIKLLCEDYPDFMIMIRDMVEVIQDGKT